jgi:heme oxygenase
MKIDTLKRATALDHQRAEASLPLMDQKIDMSTYREYLQALRGLVAAWEDASLRAAPVGLRELILCRRRLSMLDADLAWHGVAPIEHEGLTMPGLGTTATLLGAMYVMEGSALGGRVIARHLESTLLLNPRQGNAYFRGFEERTGPLWREFCEVFERTVPESESEIAIAGAREMFRAFEVISRHCISERRAVPGDAVATQRSYGVGGSVLR